MALYFYFNETTGDLVYSDQATYGVSGYTSLGEQEDINPGTALNWVFDTKRASIKSVSKDLDMIKRISELKSMNYMFTNCNALTSIDLSGFDTSGIMRISRMFNNCSSLSSLDLSNFNTSNVNAMTGMFDGCSSLISLDLSSFDTSNVDDMSQMFENCSSLISLDLSSFDTSQIDESATTFNGFQNIFSGCSDLQIITISDKALNASSFLPSPQYYPAAGGDPVARVDLTAGTWVRDEVDLSMVTSIVEQAQMSQAISRRIGKLNRDLHSAIDAVRPSVDIVKTTAHSTSYTKDTLEFVVDSSGKVTSVYFIDATTNHSGGSTGSQ